MTTSWVVKETNAFQDFNGIGFGFIMTFFNIAGLLMMTNDIFNGDLWDKFNNSSVQKKNILKIVGLFYVCFSLGSPFILGYLTQLKTYQTACNNFQIEFQGDSSNTILSFNGKSIGEFTWNDVNTDKLEIAFIAKDDMFGNGNLNGISEMKFEIDRGVGIGVISTKCYGDVGDCLNGEIKFNPTVKHMSNHALNENTNNPMSNHALNEKTNNPMSNHHVISYRNNAIKILNNNNLVTQVSNNPKGTDFKVCSNNLRDAIIGSTIAKSMLIKPCESCLEICRNDISNVCDSFKCVVGFKSCLKLCWDKCQGVFSNSES
jgi:hypothetical protein